MALGAFGGQLLPGFCMKRLTRCATFFAGQAVEPGEERVHKAGLTLLWHFRAYVQVALGLGKREALSTHRSLSDSIVMDWAERPNANLTTGKSGLA